VGERIKDVGPFGSPAPGVAVPWSIRRKVSVDVVVGVVLDLALE